MSERTVSTISYGRAKGGNIWKWWASRYLKGEYGIVEESAWGYELTERGELVDQAYGIWRKNH